MRVLNLPPAAFYDLRHKNVWEAILELSRGNQVIDEITVFDYLTRRNIQFGGMEYLQTIMASSPSASNLNYYLTGVVEFHRRRYVIAAAVRMEALARDVTKPDFLSAVEVIQAKMTQTKDVLGPGEAADRMISDLERRHALQGRLSGLESGFKALDAKLDGFQFGEQTIIAARPSKGKTALGLSVLEHCVFDLHQPALFVSLEMSAEALMRRLCAMRTGVGMNTIRRGSYDEGTFHKFSRFNAEARKSGLYLLDGVKGFSITDLEWQVRRMVRKHGIKLVVVDYLQKIRPLNKQEKKTYEIGETSGCLKALAEDAKVALVTLAQLNREGEKDKGRPPRLSDLADSGQIERDADTVILIDRNQDDVDTRLIIAKQRDGETGVVHLNFNGALTRFENQPVIHFQDVPKTNQK